MSAPETGSGRPLRILMVAATPYFADRGCHVRIQGEAQALERSGAEVGIVTYGLGRDVPGGRIRRIPALPGYRRLDAAPSLAKFPLDLALLASVLAEGKRWRPDLLHAHTQEGGLIAVLAARPLGLPVLLDLQSRRVAEELVHYGWTREGGLLFRVADLFDRAVPRAASAVVCSTNEIARDARAALPERIAVEVLADAIDVPVRPPPFDAELAIALGLDPARPILAYLGLLTHTQGIDLLLASAVRLRETHPGLQWLVMGYGDDAHWRGAARRLGVEREVVFTGRVPFEAAPAHLALATLALSPKRTTTEGNGKLLLYMSLGIASLALDTASNRELLGPDGDYAEDDPGAFAGAVAAALARKDQLRQAGARLRERARSEFSWDARATQLRALYARLLT